MGGRGAAGGPRCEEPGGGAGGGVRQQGVVRKVIGPSGALRERRLLQHRHFTHCGE